MVDANQELRIKRAAYDVATLIKVLPWIFVMRDQRGPDFLVKASFAEVQRIIDAQTGPDADRWALMRGLMANWMQAIGIPHDPNAIEMIVGLVSQTVDAYIKATYDDGLKGEPG